jgi:uncharacterized membrane protein YagU involved in acid resistance
MMVGDHGGELLMSTVATSERSRVLIRGAIGGVVGGVVAGGLFLVLNMWFATSMHQPARMPLLMMSTILQGNDAIKDGSALVGVGVLVHAVLSIGFGVVFSVVASRLRTNGSLALAGAVFGIVLYLVNLKIFAPAAFHVFEDANQPFELVTHVVFGVVLSLEFFSSGTRRGEPVVAIGDLESVGR